MFGKNTETSKETIDSTNEEPGVKRNVIKVKTTQNFSPIRDIKDGIIITKDGRFVKVMEFSAINFNLRSAKERATIIDSFAQAIKLLPSRAQWKVVSKAANTSNFIKRIGSQMKTEENVNCRKMQQEQMNLIRRLGSQNSVSRRFFLAFEYEQPAGVNKRPPFSEIRDDLETTALRVASVLSTCGNEVLSPAGDDEYTMEMLHSIMCRAENEEFDGFQNRVRNVVASYMTQTDIDFDKDNVYIPINDFICPQKIDSSQSPNYIVVNDTYYAFAYLPSNTYPNRVAGGWLSVLTDFGIGFDVDMFIKKENIATVQQKLQYAIRYNRVKARDTEESAAGFNDLVGAIDSGFYLRDGISNGEDFIYMSTLLTVSADSERELREKMSALKSYLLTQNLKCKFCTFQQEEAFRSSLPICQLDSRIQKKSRRNVLTSSIASAYPFVSFEIADPTGILYGVNRSNNSIVFIDNFNDKLYKNANMVILGTTGAGKTFTLQCMALRMRQQKTQVFIIAPNKGHEFKRACDAIGGEYIKISSGSEHSINIMEIRKKDDANTLWIDGEDNNRSSILSKKIQQIHGFVQLILPDISYEEKQVLDEALVRTYEKFGITNRNRSLNDPTRPGQYKKMPILGDLHKTLKDMGRPAERIYRVLNTYISGSAKSFNRQTNVNLDNKYIILDISEASKEMLPIAMYIVLDYVYDKAKEDRTKRKAIFIDEAWILLRAHTFIMEIFKVIRAYGGAAIAATQDMQDFMGTDNGRFGKAVINNAKTKIIMNLEAEEAEFVSETLNLTEREISQITNFKRGEGLIVSNSNHVSVRIEASNTEYDLITTSRADLARIADQKKRSTEYDEVLQNSQQS